MALLKEKDFIERYDSGDTFSEKEIKQMCWSELGVEVDRIEGENRRWSRIVTVVFQINERYFMIDYDEGLTEYQENEYYDNRPTEVRPYEKTIIVKEWKPI